jgi:CRISPR-associated protein (TIGR03986 family)
MKYKENKSKINVKCLPYNFISFPEDEKWEYPYHLTELPRHNEDSELCGVIEYNFITRSKMTTNFRLGTDGSIYISGSDVRGKVRSNLEILSYSYPEFIYSEGFLYRDFTSRTNLSKEYKNKLGINSKKIDEVIHTGYMYEKNGTYYVAPAKKIGNKYFETIEEYRLRGMKSLKKQGIGYMYYYTNNEDEEIRRLKETESSISRMIRSMRNDLELNADKEFNKKMKNIYCKIRNKWKNRSYLEKELNNIFSDYYNKENGKKYRSLKDKYLERSEVKKSIDNIYNELKKSNDFIPYQKEIEYTHNNRGIEEIRTIGSKDKELGFEKGILYCSTNASSKRNHYVIGVKDKNINWKIDNSVIMRYNKNMESFKLTTKKNLETIKEFYDLFGSTEDKGKSEKVEKIVFYTLDENNNINNIGRTPYLKVAYENTIKDLLEKNIKSDSDRCSYAEAIFGFTGKGNNNKESYKSRVRFSNILPENNQKIVLETDKFSLDSPRASALGMYLKQDNSGNINTYNDKDSRLRGYKFYHIQEKAINKSNDNKRNDKKKKEEEDRENTIIGKDITFKGKIYFNNLREEELGLLLMSIDAKLLNNHISDIKGQKENIQDIYEQIGGAKAYGYGKIEIEIDSISLKDKNYFDFDSNPYKTKLLDE